MNISNTTEALSETLSRARMNSLVDAGELDVTLKASLKALTSFRTGGDADAAVTVSSERALLLAVSEARRLGEKFYILGNGTNVLSPDEGYRGTVIVTTGMKHYEINGTTVKSECGMSLTSLAAACGRAGLSGLEFAYGIPGTIGGGVFMNAGAYDGELREVITSVRALMPDGKIKEFTCDECDFGYRHSAFEDNGAIILGCTMELSSGDPNEIRQKMDELMARRREKQPLGFPSAGSTFKRYPGRYTGKMIEDCGLKGASVGGAKVSEKHAGFIINYNNATSNDILELIGLVKSEILKKEGVAIECEVRLLG